MRSLEHSLRNHQSSKEEMKVSRIPYEIKKSLFYRNKLLRRVQTKNFTSDKFAIGENCDYHFPNDWIKIDYSRADFNINLNEPSTLPFDDNSMRLAYSAHCLEHLEEKYVAEVLKECFRVMRPGGTVRLEVPDMLKVIDCYKRNDTEYIEFFHDKHQWLIDKLGFDKHYLEDHVGMLATISNYFIDGVNFQIPVYASKKECDEKLNSMTMDEFGDWCISLQTDEQIRSAGHKTFFYFDKLKRILNDVGFTDVSELDIDKSNSDAFRLNKGSKDSIREKKHRNFFSLYVEAKKPK